MRRLALLLICGSGLLGLLGPAEAEAATTAGIVEGTVTPLAWAQEVEVCVVESQPSETCTEPGVGGSYKLLSVPLGGAQIEFIPSFRSGLLKQYYDGVGKLSEARTIVLSPQSSTRAEIDADLLEGGAIEGTVSAVGGVTPLSEVEVCAVSSGSPTTKSCAETDANGGYELRSLSTGLYRIGFTGTGRSAEYEPSSRSVSVVAGGANSDVDASLTKGAQIRGMITAAGRGRLPDVPVCLFVAAASAPLRCIASDEAGEYSFVGLSGGEYQVGFSLEPAELGWQAGTVEDGFESQYYDGVGTRADAKTISLIAPAAAVEVDASLLSPQMPPSPAAAPFAASPIVAAPPVIAVPTPKKIVCRKGYRKTRAKGKTRCVKQAKKTRKRGAKKRHHQRRKKVFRPPTTRR